MPFFTFIGARFMNDVFNYKIIDFYIFLMLEANKKSQKTVYC